MDARLITGQVAGWPVAVLRIAMGVLWLVTVSATLAHADTWSDEVHQYLLASSHSSFGFYQDFLGVVSDHYKIIAWLTLVCELLVGIALALGAFARLAAALGLLMALNFWLVAGAAFWDPKYHVSYYILIMFVLMFTRSGRLMGLDFYLCRRHPEWPFW